MIGAVRTCRDVWRWRHLVRALTLYTIKTDNRNTIIGNVWHLLNPLLTMCIFMFVFKVLFKGRQPNYVVFFFCGSIFFRLWTSSLTQGAQVLVKHGPLLKSSYFPRIVAVAPLALMNLYNVAVESMVLAILMLAFRVVPGWQLVLAAPLVVVTLIGTTGVSLLMSCPGARFRDLGNLLLHVNRVLFYFSPVMYPVTFIPEKYRGFYFLNPVTCAIEFARDTITRGKTPMPGFMIYYTCLCVVLFVVGLAVFVKLEARTVKYL